MGSSQPFRKFSKYKLTLLEFLHLLKKIISMDSYGFSLSSWKILYTYLEIIFFKHGAYPYIHTDILTY